MATPRPLIKNHAFDLRGKNKSTATQTLADAKVAAGLLSQIRHDLRTRHRVDQPAHALLTTLQRCAKPAVPALMAKYAGAA